MLILGWITFLGVTGLAGWGATHYAGHGLVRSVLAAFVLLPLLEYALARQEHRQWIRFTASLILLFATVSVVVFTILISPGPNHWSSWLSLFCGAFLSLVMWTLWGMLNEGISARRDAMRGKCSRTAA